MVLHLFQIDEQEISCEFIDCIKTNLKNIIIKIVNYSVDYFVQ